MAKPVITTFNTIAPLLIQQYERYLPSAFDDGLTMLEKVNKIIEYLNQIGELNNNVVEQWNSVMEWVMNDGLTQDVNAKLDEMVLDGTLDSIINQNIFNELNNEINQIGKIGISLESYPLIIGENDDTQRMIRAMQNNRVVILPYNKEYSIANIETQMDGQSIIGGKIVDNATGTTVKINHSDCCIQHVEFLSNQATYTISISTDSKRTKIMHNSFSGSIGHWIIDNGDLTTITFNRFNGQTNTQISPVVFSGATNFKINNNVFDDVTGFNIQTRWSENGVISNNTFKNPRYESEIVATSGQTSLSFTLPFSCSRTGIQINGVVPAPSAYSINDDSEPTYIVTFNNALQSNDIVTFIGYRSLEHVNINSESKHIIVTGNSMEGTGDSSVVMGSDYHNRILDPTFTQPTEYPNGIIVSDNQIQDCAYAGVAETHSVDGVVISNNVISDCGFLDDFIYSAGVFITGGKDVVTGNTIRNTEIGITRYGISHSSTTNDNFGFDPTVKIGFNNFIGMKTKNHLIPSDSSASTRKKDILLLNGNKSDYPSQPDLDSTWSNRPSDTSYFIYTQSGTTGWIRDTVNVLGGNASIKTVVGEYCQIYLTAKDIFKDSILELTFWAKPQSISDSGYVSLYYDFSTDDAEPKYQLIIDGSNTTQWRKYRLSMGVGLGSIDNIFVRVGGTTGAINVQHIEFRYTPVD